MSKQIQNRKAGLYYRLSQEDERAGESLSIENQKKIIEKYARENGFEIIDEYIDDGWSGTNFNRPGVQRLLEDAKNGRINTIIVKDLSRFGRNYIEVGQYTDYLFPTYNIRFIAVGDNVDSAVAENTGMDMTPIMNVFNEWHAANTSKKIRAVIEANAKEGIYRCTYAPYGYIKGTDAKRLPVIDPEAVAYVRRIFEMRASGISPNHIAQTYNNEGILPPGDYKEQKLGIPNTRKSHHLWSGATVKQVLTNPIYLGHMVQLKTTNVSYKNKKQIKRDPEDMVWVYNTHEAIVTQELWDRCREMEASVSQGKKNKTGYVNPLSGLVFCADCGNKMYIKFNNTRHQRGGDRIYYRENFSCGAYSKFGERACTSHYIQIKILSQLVLADIRSKMNLVLADEKRARAEFLSRSEQQNAAEANADRRKLTQSTRRLAELDKLIGSVYEDKVLGKIPEEVCIGLLEKYQSEKTALTETVAALERKAQTVRDDAANADEFIRRLKAYMEIPELTRQMCLELIEFITVDKCPGKYSKAPREIHIYYKLIDKKSSAEQKQMWETNENL